MKRFLLLLLPVSLCLFSCSRRPMHVVSVETTMLAVDSSFNALQDTAYLAYISPVHDSLESMLSVPLGYAPEPMTAHKPESPLLNWASDALLEMARQETGDKPDLAVVNCGGLRCSWAKGDITFRSVFELMPFDNELVILTMTGDKLLLLAQNCVEQGGQGVSAGFRVEGKDGKLTHLTLNGKEVMPEAYYKVATSDYLSGGADGLTALTMFEERTMTGRKIRDLYIEYVKQQKTVTAAVDGRMKIE